MKNKYMVKAKTSNSRRNIQSLLVSEISAFLEQPIYNIGF